MKKKTGLTLALGAALIALSFTSCNEKTDQQNSAVQNSTNTSATTNSPQADAEEGNEVRLNPQHGLPGHRCDLPVGAPLPSDSETKVTPTPAQTEVNPGVSPIRVDKKPSVNPPHGEPGHNCAIPVGAPLE